MKGVLNCTLALIE